jgi:hypothetical protein
MLTSILKLLTHNSKLSSRAYNRLGPEDKLAVKVAASLREWSLSGRLEGVWTHPSNEIAGGTKGAAVKYAIACAMGMITGAPDYLFISNNGGALIELKSKTGRLNDNQKNFKAWAEKHNVPYALCRSLEEVEVFLCDVGLLAPLAGYGRAA